VPRERSVDVLQVGRVLSRVSRRFGVGPNPCGLDDLVPDVPRAKVGGQVLLLVKPVGNLAAACEKEIL
jgi:hypothetical protein